MKLRLGFGLRRLLKNLRVAGKQKIFCIGLNKTGTTSLQKEMQNLGFVVGNSRQAEFLFDDWIKRDFRSIIKYCHTAQFFQDIPFSLPFTFSAVDQAFPGSKFIHTVRDNADQWYDSLVRFHGNKWADGRIPPTSEDLKNAIYINKGNPFHFMMHIYNATEDEPYNKDILLDYYDTYNKNVLDYFRNRPYDLITIKVKEADDYARFCNFIGVIQKKSSFPWENRSM